MQASWGAENNAPTPARGAELYGEDGRYVQSAIESVPWYLTRAEMRAAKNPKKWDEGVSSTGVTAQSTKRPAEMDVVPQGVKVTTGSKPNKMTMADHDHGIVWPPAKGNERSLPFMAMVNKERDGLPNNKKDHHLEVNGIMVGYQGHVPRARDKIGGCPLGKVPGRPGAPSLSADKGYVQSSKSVQNSTRDASPHPLSPALPLLYLPSLTCPWSPHLPLAPSSPLSSIASHRLLTCPAPRVTRMQEWSRLSTSLRRMTRS